MACDPVARAIGTAPRDYNAVIFRLPS